ncbi:hypothetical protein BHE74_00003817 [Ensete ventricosum]|nr:hypothetical protein BHE74_00003817 [Ensete ventricosum]
MGRRGNALSCRLIFRWENETLPRPLAGRLGGASSLSWKTRRRLTNEAVDEALPHSRAGRQGTASPSSPRKKTRRRLVSPMM